MSQKEGSNRRARTLETHRMQGLEQNLRHPWLSNGWEGLGAASAGLPRCWAPPVPAGSGVDQGFQTAWPGHRRSEFARPHTAAATCGSRKERRSPTRDAVPPRPAAAPPRPASHALALLVLRAAPRARRGSPPLGVRRSSRVAQGSPPLAARGASSERRGWGAVQDYGALQPPGLHAQLQEEAQGLQRHQAPDATRASRGTHAPESAPATRGTR